MSEGGLQQLSTPQPSPWRLVLTLAAAGLVAGLALSGVYLATAPRIERNRAEALRRAIFEVLPGTTETAAHVESDGAVTAHAADAGPPPPDAVFVGWSESGEVVGWAIPAEGPGFMDTVRVLYGYDAVEKRIIGLAVLESRETPGLGDKIDYDPDWKANFVALAVEPEIVALRREEKTQPNEVDCITGATISSEAVVSMLNRSVEHWKPVLDAAEVPVAPAPRPVPAPGSEAPPEAAPGTPDTPTGEETAP
jgi:electron transport complex protein RnfG